MRDAIFRIASAIALRICPLEKYKYGVAVHRVQDSRVRDADRHTLP